MIGSRSPKIARSIIMCSIASMSSASYLAKVMEFGDAECHEYVNTAFRTTLSNT
jgi:hypothetical protein